MLLSKLFKSKNIEETSEENITGMKIIVGLGNPGSKYAGTRHNTGFSVIYGLSDKYKIQLNKKECKSVTGRGLIGNEKVLLAMPQTYMNLSGEAVRELINYYKEETSDLIIIYDDKDLPVGKLRIKPEGSAGGHNGIKSIISQIGTEKFDRIRVGIGAAEGQMELADHVLGRFTDDERSVIREAVDRAVDAVQVIIDEGVDRAMNKFN